MYVYILYMSLIYLYVLWPLRCAAHGLIHPRYARKHVGATEVFETCWSHGKESWTKTDQEAWLLWSSNTTLFFRWRMFVYIFLYIGISHALVLIQLHPYQNCKSCISCQELHEKLTEALLACEGHHDADHWGFTTANFVEKVEKSGHPEKDPFKRTTWILCVCNFAFLHHLRADTSLPCLRVAEF